MQPSAPSFSATCLTVSPNQPAVVRDARERLLRRKLTSKGWHPGESSTDVELVLRAYQVWGHNLCDHIFGDFAFIIWDSLKQTLFCARDQLGVRPVFYWYDRSAVMVSSSLDCIRLNPAVSSSLDDAWIVDFLTEGISLDPERTVYSAIKRLPAAHKFVADCHRNRIGNYWTLKVGEPIVYRNEAEYVDEFQALLTAAVRDRLPSREIGLFLSGGLDSGALAATVDL